MAAAMDWFSWMSKTGLEPSLVYEYGLAFSRNELEQDDVSYFNHEFLQSMGISVAKHRLEILKLAKKENEAAHRRPRPASWLIKTKKCFTKYFGRLNDVSFSPRRSGVDDPPLRLEKCQEQWRGGGGGAPPPRKQKTLPQVKTRSIALSGPLDLRAHERLMMAPPRSLKLSGPLDSKVNERLMYTANRSPRITAGPLVTDKLMVATRSPKLSGPLDPRSYDRLMVTTNKSPKLSGPLDGRVNPFEKEKMDDDFDDHSLWTALFQDMKPT